MYSLKRKVCVKIESKTSKELNTAQKHKTHQVESQRAVTTRIS